MALLAGIVMLMFGVELKKSLLTAVLYSTLRFGVVFCLGMLAGAG
jgi:hypothetical protein